MPVPQVAAGAVEHATGRLVIYAPESLRVNPGKTEGLRSISFKEAAEGTAAAPREPAARGRPVLAFAFTQEPTTLRLAVRAAKTPGDHPPVARRPDRTGRGEVPGHLPLQHSL